MGTGRLVVMLLAGVSMLCILLGDGVTALAAGACPGPHHRRPPHRPPAVASRDGHRGCDQDDTARIRYGHRAFDAPWCLPLPSAGPPSPRPVTRPEGTPPPAVDVTGVGSGSPAPDSPPPPPLPVSQPPPVLAPPALTVPAVAPPPTIRNTVPVSIYVITLSTLVLAAVIALAALVLVRRAD